MRFMAIRLLDDVNVKILYNNTIPLLYLCIETQLAGEPGSLSVFGMLFMSGCYDRNTDISMFVQW